MLSLTFSSPPKIVIVINKNVGITSTSANMADPAHFLISLNGVLKDEMYGGRRGSRNYSWSGNRVSWYCEDYIDRMLNESNNTYLYAGIL